MIDIQHFKYCALAAAILLCSLGPAHAQSESPAAVDAATNTETVVTVARDGYSIAGLVTQLQTVKKFKYAIALFPGYPGILRLREENGRAVFELGGNFLVRARNDWLDPETLVVTIDAPSDQWRTFSQNFRESARYGADVAALLGEIGRQHGVEDWTFVGTSEGSISAFQAARMNPQLARRTILTASLFLPTRNGSGLSDIKVSDLTMPLLWVHHESDPCEYTPYRQAVEFSRKSHAPLITVKGGSSGYGDACKARTAHGFIGIERETVLAMRNWVMTGTAPAELTK
jgi:hypothetical protein